MDFNKINDLSNVESISILKDKISQVMLEKKYSTVSFTSLKFSGLYRARKHNHKEGKLNKNGILKKFINESEFWEVPSIYAERGRCNDDFENIFYCANDIVTAILEVKPKIGEYVSVGNFINMFPNKDFQIKPVAKRSLYKIEKIRNNLMKGFTFDKRHNDVEDFLDQLYCVNIEDKNDYKLSNAVAKIFLTDSFNSSGDTIETHGLIYPSIIRNQNSHCYAIKTWVARCFFELIYIQTLKIISIEDNAIKAKIVRNGNNIGQKKCYPNDLFDVNWMIPPKTSNDFETLVF